MSEWSYCIVICVGISVHKTIVLNDSFLWDGNPLHENRSRVWQNRFRTINIKLIAYSIINNISTILETHKWFSIQDKYDGRPRLCSPFLLPRADLEIKNHTHDPKNVSKLHKPHISNTYHGISVMLRRKTYRYLKNRNVWTRRLIFPTRKYVHENVFPGFKKSVWIITTKQTLQSVDI